MPSHSRRIERGLLLLIVAFFLRVPLASAQEDPSWRNLERGKLLFSQRQFGDALLAFNKSVLDRNDRFSAAVTTLDSVLASKEAKSAGDSIRRLIDRFAKEDLRLGDIAKIKDGSRGYFSLELKAYETYRISDAFQNLVYALQAGMGLKPPEYFGDSLGALRAFLDKSRLFPEAEYWIAKVYMTEGEYEIAQRQLEKAAAAESSLEVPEFIYEIEYLLADVHKTKKNLAAMETAYQQILKHDKLYSDDANKFLREAMKRTITTEGVDKFLILYRHDADFADVAYAALGEYYCKSGRYSQAIEHLMVVADVLVTKIIGDIVLDDPEYRYSDLPDLLARVEASAELSRFAEEMNFHRVLYYLGASLWGDGRTGPARGIWSGLAGVKGDWAQMARAQLKSPSIQKADPDPEF